MSPDPPPTPAPGPFATADSSASTDSSALSDSSATGVLRRVFGFREFRPHQGEIVEHLIAGGDAFVLMPTGGGKSLCYQIPAIVRPGVGIVVSPLISLMKDQVDALLASGVRAAFYNSSLDSDEARRVLARLHGGELDLLYVAPERLMTDGFLERLRGLGDGRVPRDAMSTAAGGATGGAAAPPVAPPAAVLIASRGTRPSPSPRSRSRKPSVMRRSGAT